MKKGDLVRFKFDGYHKAYGIGFVTKIQYDEGTGEGLGYALFKNERLVFRFSEMELVNEKR